MGFFTGVLIIAAIIAVFVHRGLQMKNLANNGVVGDGKVVKKSRRPNSKGGRATPYLRYEFHGPDGRRYERKIAVGENVYKSYEEGDPIDIVFIRDKPGVNAARFTVNQSREALNLPPL